VLRLCCGRIVGVRRSLYFGKVGGVRRRSCCISVRKRNWVNFPLETRCGFVCEKRKEVPTKKSEKQWSSQKRTRIKTNNKKRKKKKKKKESRIRQ
jgi:hypothetical protein